MIKQDHTCPPKKELQSGNMIDDRDEAVVSHISETAKEQDGAEDESIFSSEPRQASDGTLGPGPLRFAAKGERSIGDQIASLSTDQKQCFDNLKTRWKERYPDKPLSDEMILRFARCSPGRNKFNERSAWNVMQRFDRRYLVLTASRLEPQLLSKTLFPVPGLVTKDGHHVFFMRASRYFPSQTPTKVIVDNLAYVSISESETHVVMVLSNFLYQLVRPQFSVYDLHDGAGEIMYGRNRFSVLYAGLEAS